MDQISAAHALARATATLIDTRDVPGTLAALLRGAKDAMEVDAAGILIQMRGHLDLLAASSHQASELETLQAQLEEGPCVDAHASGEPVAVSGSAQMRSTWPAFGPTMLNAGYSSVHASPLRWRQSTIGAMGLFRRSDQAFTVEDDTFAQAFADIATTLIVSTQDLVGDELMTRLQTALSARTVIEQAKGVLAEQRGLGMAEAYELLLQSATNRREPLGDLATRIVRNASPS